MSQAPTERPRILPSKKRSGCHRKYMGNSALLRAPLQSVQCSEEEFNSRANYLHSWFVTYLHLNRCVLRIVSKQAWVDSPKKENSVIIYSPQCHLQNTNEDLLMKSESFLSLHWQMHKKVHRKTNPSGLSGLVLWWTDLFYSFIHI